MTVSENIKDSVRNPDNSTTHLSSSTHYPSDPHPVAIVKVSHHLSQLPIPNKATVLPKPGTQLPFLPFYDSSSQEQISPKPDFQPDDFLRPFWILLGLSTHRTNSHTQAGA